jgi:glutathione S-transferase
MTEIILHNYPRSPFAEKVRLVFGFKGIDWRSVVIPSVPPKPDLMPLTGGYRKTPVLQIGADIYCDTAIILREIDRRFPNPSLYGAGLGPLISGWADSTLFVNTVGVVMGTFADQMAPAMKDDRYQFTNGLFDAARFKTQQPALRAAFRGYAAWIEGALADQRKFLTGSVPDIADFSVYHPLWFVRSNIKDVDLLADYPLASAWRERMAAFGHGTPTELDAKEALAIAKNAQPAALEQQPCADMSGCRPGDAVSVAANDYGRDPVAGELVAIDDTAIVIRRHDSDVSEVNLHFPRIGFDVTPK